MMPTGVEWMEVQVKDAARRNPKVGNKACTARLLDV